ncbi:MAG: CPBP family intramembrane metalloprotease [Proteobacteria bacterium]|nr:CPBP family intramembrane metalloprotease [Pseudomonadota bacterium]
MVDFRRARQVFFRLLMAFAAYLATMQFFRLLLLPAIQHVFHPGDAVTSLVRRIGIFCFAVLGYWAYVRLVEKRKVPELRPRPLGIAVGGLSGAGLIGLAMGLLFASGVYVTTAYHGLQEGLWGIAGVIVIAATLEEIVFRCILFRILETGWGTMPALWLNSLIFAFMHIGNVEDRASPQEVVATVLSCVLIGALWTLVFVHSRNLWVAAANHAAWNFTIFLSGVPLSGSEDWRGHALFASEYRGPAWLTGGVFGPEASLLTLAIVVASLAGMIHWARAKHRLVRAGTAPLHPEVSLE